MTRRPMQYTRSKGTSADNSDMAASRPAAAAGSGRGGEGTGRAGGRRGVSAGPGRGARRGPHPPTEGKRRRCHKQRPGSPRLPPFWACAVAGEGKGRRRADRPRRRQQQRRRGGSAPAGTAGKRGRGRRRGAAGTTQQRGGRRWRCDSPPGEAAGLGHRGSWCQVCDSYRQSVPRRSEAHGVASGSRG